MGQVSVTLNDRVFRLGCDEGEEDRLVELATYVKSKVAQLTAEHGHAGDERLMLMAALLIADELWDARASVDGLTAALDEATRPVDSADIDDPEPVRRLKNLAARMSTGGMDDASAGDNRIKPAPNSKRRGLA